MQSPFDRATEIILRLEGGFSDDPADDGGATQFGLSQNNNPDIDMRSLTRERAIRLYRERYWEPAGCPSLPWCFALAVYDASVNQGPRTAVKLFQRSIGVGDDGVFGPVTLRAALWAHNHDRMSPTLADFFSRRIKRYAEHPDWPTYGRGWSRRCFIVQQECLTL